MKIREYTQHTQMDKRQDNDLDSFKGQRTIYNCKKMLEIIKCLQEK